MPTSHDCNNWYDYNFIIFHEFYLRKHRGGIYMSLLATRELSNILHLFFHVISLSIALCRDGFRIFKFMSSELTVLFYFSSFEMD